MNDDSEKLLHKNPVNESHIHRNYIIYRDGGLRPHNNVPQLIASSSAAATASHRNENTGEVLRMGKL